MKTYQTEIPDVVLLEPRIHRDDRGFFLESFNPRTMQAAGIDCAFVQDNHARSQRGVLRGLHYQIQQPQGKIVRVVQGRIFDVAVDLRKDSTYFGKWVGVELDGDSLKMLWVPPGFAHGYLVLSDTADVVYKTTEYYAPQYDRTLLWNDPEVGVAWPGERGSFILSAKDSAGTPLSEAEVYL